MIDQRRNRGGRRAGSGNPGGGRALAACPRGRRATVGSLPVNIVDTVGDVHVRNRRLPGAGPRGRTGLVPGWRPRPSGSATAGPMTKASTPTTTSPSATSGWPSSTCRRPATSRCDPPTGATGWSSTARSTTTSSWGVSCWSRAWSCGRAATPRSCSRLYARVGKDVVHQLRGMYAFAIWDSWTRETVLRQGPVRHQAVLLPPRPEPGAGAGREKQRAARGGRGLDDGNGDAEALPAGGRTTGSPPRPAGRGG